jgi:hypothetical protein
VSREEDGTTSTALGVSERALKRWRKLLLIVTARRVDEPNKAGHTALALGGDWRSLQSACFTWCSPARIRSRPTRSGTTGCCTPRSTAMRSPATSSCTPTASFRASSCRRTSPRTPRSPRPSPTATARATPRSTGPPTAARCRPSASCCRRAPRSPTPTTAGCTALHWAAIRNHADVAKFLVGEGALARRRRRPGQDRRGLGDGQGRQADRLRAPLRRSPPGLLPAAARSSSRSAAPPWFAVGAGAAIGAGLLWITQPWYVSWFLIAATYFVARNRLRHMFPGPTSSKTPTFVGIFTGLYRRVVLHVLDAHCDRLPGSESHPIPFWLHALFVAVNLRLHSALLHADVSQSGLHRQDGAERHSRVRRRRARVERRRRRRRG